MDMAGFLVAPGQKNHLDRPGCLVSCDAKSFDDAIKAPRCVKLICRKVLLARVPATLRRNPSRPQYGETDAILLPLRTGDVAASRAT